MYPATLFVFSWLPNQVPGTSLCLSVVLPGNNSAELLRVPQEEDWRVGDIKKAVVADFSQLIGLKADQVQLFRVNGDARIPLDPTDTLSDAGIHAGTKLAVELTTVTHVPVAGVWQVLLTMLQVQSI